MSPFLLHMVSKNKIESIVNEWVKANDCFLVDVKTPTSGILVFIDKPTGVTLEECAALNKHITAQLEPEGVWENHELEVSSPGMDQPLKVYQQYQRRVGRELKVITTSGTSLQGILKSASEKGIEVLESVSRKENKKKIINETLHHLDYDQVKEAKLILSFKF